ncbi:uncharacterized protein LOC119727584 [Patiria miniata]|uniref:CCHC-type domain-containing protein n=1 Tax=Patiria miniata TaxID=46514 RepID=A0A913ZUR6_PATMI|nr:uncharacterized protein LOC119727584 [Patiria miniata]
MAESAQDVCQRLIEQVSRLSLLQLQEVCKHLDLPGYQEVECPKALRRKVSRNLLREELEEKEDEGLSLYTDLRDFLKQIVVAENLPAADPKPEQKPSTTPKLDTTPASLMTLTRREFKISGQIGEPGQRDRLSFSSLAHQIESGRAKGHKEREIVEAVIRAVVPGSALRSYLEGRAGLTLPVLRHILRAHYQEKDATELYHRLSRLAQDSKESAQSFLVRALDLKQKVIFASQESGSGLKYDPTLVQNMFLHALLTGFRSESVKNELRSLLQDPSTTDELLFEKVNTAASHEMERQEKLHSKSVSVHEVQQYESSQEAVKRKPKEGTLMTDIAELKAGIMEIATMRKQLDSLQESLTTPANQNHQLRRPSGRPLKRGCRHCQQNGNGDTCDHCFKCGSSEHFARGCRTRSSQSGNEQGLLPRDGQ